MIIMGIWDALNDPLMGTLVDKTRTNLGNCVPIRPDTPLGIATVVFFGAEFLAGVRSTTAQDSLYVRHIFHLGFFYTIGDIPFWGLPPRYPLNPVDRSNAITSARPPPA